MTGERAWTAPEMTPSVDSPDETERLAEDRRGMLDQAATEEPKPGEVPGIETRVEGRSQLGTTPSDPEESDGPDVRDLPPHG
jgi:hypothetical protein